MPPMLTCQERRTACWRATNRSTLEDALPAFPGHAALVRRSRLPRHSAPASRKRCRWAACTCWWRASNTPTARPNATCCRWRPSRRRRYVAPHALAAHPALARQARRRWSTRWKTARRRARCWRPSSRARAAHRCRRHRSRRCRSSSSKLAEAEPTNISAQHAAAAIRYGDRYLLKMFRRLEEGVSPELELGRFLNTARARPHARRGRRHRIPAATAPSRARWRCSRPTSPTRGPPGRTPARSCAASSSAC